MSVCSGAPQLSTINGFTALRYITNLAVVATRVTACRNHGFRMSFHGCVTIRDVIIDVM